MKTLKKSLGLLALLLMMAVGMCVSAEAAGIYPKQTAATEHTVTLSWNAVPGTSIYQIRYWSPNGSSQIATTAANSYTFSGLAADTLYAYDIKAYNLANQELASFISTTSTVYARTSILATTPGKVKTVSPQAWGMTSGCSFKLTKNAYPNTMEGIEWKLLNRTKKKTMASGTSTYDQFYASVKTNQTYVLKVRGYTIVNGTKFYGPWYSKTVVPQPYMTAFKLVNGGIQVNWQKVAGASKYYVYASTQSGSGYKKVATVANTKSSYVVYKVNGASLVRYKNYYFKVVAVKGSTKSTATNYRSGYIYLTYR